MAKRCCSSVRPYLILDAAAQLHVQRLPGVLAVRETLPLHKVLGLLAFPSPAVQHGLHIKLVPQQRRRRRPALPVAAALRPLLLAAGETVILMTPPVYPY